jgi:hypothetical protein
MPTSILLIFCVRRDWSRKCWFSISQDSEGPPPAQRSSVTTGNPCLDTSNTSDGRPVARLAFAICWSQHRKAFRRWRSLLRPAITHTAVALLVHHSCPIMLNPKLQRYSVTCDREISVTTASGRRVRGVLFLESRAASRRGDPMWPPGRGPPPKQGSETERRGRGPVWDASSLICTSVSPGRQPGRQSRHAPCMRCWRCEV